MIDLNNVAVDDALNFDPSGNLMALINDLGLTDVDLAGALDVSQAFANEVLVIGGEFAKTAARWEAAGVSRTVVTRLATA